MSSLVGSEIGPYRVLRLVGKGGMGEVYVARDDRLRRDVAVKALSPELAATGGFSHQLLREARAVAHLSHPNIAQVFDVIEQDGRVLLVMEYLQGETLAARLLRGPLPDSDFFTCADQIASALVHAHTHGVLHCDLKPGNVFLTDEGVVKVLDFGLARIAVADTEHPTTATGLATSLLLDRAGTPGYMSPEQRSGGAIDERSDIFSFGVVLRDMSSDRSARVDPDGTTRLRSAASTLPARLSPIIDRARAENPDRRFRSVADLRAALVAVRDAPRRGRWSAFIPTTSAGLAALLVVVAPSAALLTRLAASAAPAGTSRAVVAVLPFATDGRDSAAAAVAPGLTELVANDLSHSANIVVVSDSSVRSAGLSGLPPARAGRELGATHLVLGKVRTSGDKLRVELEVFVTAAGRVAVAGAVETGYTALTSDRGALARAVRDRLTAAGLPAPNLPAQSASAPVDRLALEYYARGREYLLNADAKRNLNLAIDLFQKALDRAPGFALAHAGIAEASWRSYRDTKDPGAAVRAQAAAFDALRLAPSDPAVRYAVAMTLQETGKTSQAIDELETLLRSQPLNDDAHRVLGVLYAGSNEWANAEKHFEAALSLRPGYWRNHQAYAEACFDAGKFERAVARFQQAVNFRPESTYLYQELGTAYHALGRIAEARKSYEQANRIQPTAFAYSNLALIAYSEKRWADAVGAYKRSTELEPNEPVTWRNLGDTLLRATRRPEAMAAYKRAVDLAEAQLALNPNQAALRSLQAVCMAKSGDFAGASRSIEQALRAGNGSGEVFYHAAVVEALAGRSAEALVFVQRTVDAGYSAAMIADDEDLAPLHSDPGFSAIVKP